MSRDKLAASVAALALGLLACEPAAKPQATQAAPAETVDPADASQTAAYDWSFVQHGGSGDLDFGDGDWAEGDRVLSLSCLPGSRRVEGAEALVLTAAGADLPMETDAGVSVDQPVLAALRRTGVVQMRTDTGSRTLTGQAVGRREVEAFFAFCTTPQAAG